MKHLRPYNLVLVVRFHYWSIVILSIFENTFDSFEVKVSVFRCITSVHNSTSYFISCISIISFVHILNRNSWKFLFLFSFICIRMNRLHCFFSFNFFNRWSLTTIKSPKFLFMIFNLKFRRCRDKFICDFLTRSCSYFIISYNKLADIVINEVWVIHLINIIFISNENAEYYFIL